MPVPAASTASSFPPCPVTPQRARPSTQATVPAEPCSRVRAQAFVLQDSRSRVGSQMLFWAEGGKGYTTDLRRAQRYTLEEALAQHRVRPSDVVWPEPYLARRSRLAVDVQLYDAQVCRDWIPKNKSLLWPDLAGRFLAQMPRAYDGNNALWLTQDDCTPWITKAKLFAQDQVPQGFIVWPYAYAQHLARPVVSARGLSHAKATADLGIAWSKPQRDSTAYRYRCAGCGRFMSAQDYYTQCRCGFDNRP